MTHIRRPFVFQDGYNSNVGNDWAYLVPDEVSRLGDPVPLAATVMTIVSTSPLDTEGGDGARSVLIQALAADHSLNQFIIPLNGTTPVPTPIPLHLTTTLAVASVGPLGNNVGAINAFINGTLTAQIEPLTNRSPIGMWEIPRDNLGGDILTLSGSCFLAAGGPTAVEVRASRRDINGVTREGFLFAMHTDNAPNFKRDTISHFHLQGGDVIILEARTLRPQAIARVSSLIDIRNEGQR